MATCPMQQPDMTSLPEKAALLATKFNLAFDQSGRLKQIQIKQDNTFIFKDEGFEFDVFDGVHSKNQERYEEIGSLIDQIVFELLEEKTGLTRVTFPENEEEQSFIFASPDYATCDQLLVLIHGSGVVRAGQWARRLIMNEDLDKGTQLPYIQRARDCKFGVIVMNTNDNKRDGKKIKGSSNPEEHAKTVWEQFIKQSKANKIAIVAHSYGGIVTLELAKAFQEDFESKVFSIALTDSVHSTDLQGIKSKLLKRLQKISLNYVTSTKPVGESLGEHDNDIPVVSAGHEKHEWTSFTAMEKIFERLRIMLKEEVKDEL